MNPLKEIAELFHHEEKSVSTVKYPETAQDGGTPVNPPNADSKYFDPAYPGMTALGTLPSTEHPDSHWMEATLQGKFIPYVGEQPHGLDIKVDPSAIPVNDVDLIAARGHRFGNFQGEPHAVPVPVTIVNTPVMFGIENKISTNTFTLAANTPIMLAARRPERSKLQILVSTTGPAVIGPSFEQVSAGVGMFCPLGVLIPLSTNQPVWVTTTAAGTVISVVEEYTVVEGARRV